MEDWRYLVCLAFFMLMVVFVVCAVVLVGAGVSP